MANRRSAAKQHIGAYVPTALRERFKRTTQRQGLTETAAIITAIREWLDRNENSEDPK